MNWKELVSREDFDNNKFMLKIKKNIYEGCSFQYLGHSFKAVDQEGGEGCGDIALTVWQVDNDYHIKLIYSYYSYDGYSIDGCSVRDIYVVEKKLVQREEWVYVED